MSSNVKYVDKTYLDDDGFLGKSCIASCCHQDSHCINHPPWLTGTYITRDNEISLHGIKNCDDVVFS